MHTLLRPLAAAIAFGSALLAQNPYVAAGARLDAISDLRARNVGDILTITIQEQTRIKNEERIERRNDTTLAARLETFTLSESAFNAGVLPRFDVRKESAFNGQARQNTNSDVRASIAVVVLDVQPNGNLVVAGMRSVNINDETRTLRVSGLVRPFDVTVDNTVGSAQVADARISISGKGANTRQMTRGPMGQLFDTLVWAAWPF
ncbi:MAG TPA: flagellar basal body L-ring protein FlgH [bacterium]|nr:flagellar basal body L-ring protein FlgH [bacterium]